MIYTKDDLLAIFGTYSKVAEECGLTPGAVTNWTDPPGRNVQPKIELAIRKNPALQKRANNLKKKGLLSNA